MQSWASRPNKVKHNFGVWMESSDPDHESESLFGTDISAAIGSGTKKEWDFLRERYTNAINADVQKKDIVQALGCSKDRDILSE
jgi:hypothetical protein